jgi:antitoxin (DNA-binding transcriptional repressor) of toxin-antitoxin stability system
VDDTPQQVTVHKLIHDHRAVLDMVSRGERVEVTRRGEVVAVIVPPDRSEILLDRLASEGKMPADWRARQHRLRERLRQRPMALREPGPPTGSEALLADREETGR